MQEPTPKLYLFEAPRKIPLINIVESLLNENGIYHDEVQKLRLTQLLEAFNVNRFRYHVKNDKIIIHAISFGATEKTADSAECNFANRVLHGNNLFSDVLLDNRILFAIWTNSMLLNNLANSEVEKFCLAKSLTPFDLIKIDFDLSVCLTHVACSALLYSNKLSLSELSNLSSIERQKFLMIIENQYAYDALLAKQLNIKEAVSLNINGRSRHEMVIKEITRVKAAARELMVNESSKISIKTRPPM